MIHWREKIGIICLASFALIAGFRAIQSYKPTAWVQKIQKTGRIPVDSITRLETQFQCLNAILGPNQEAGFLTSVDASQHQEYYLLAQYFLAPSLIKDTTEAEFIVAYLPEQDARENFQAQGLSVTLDCGHGFFLLERSQAP
jgi:hypothetical protein